MSTKRYVSPEDFGAAGDGVTDDWAAIQAAINDLFATGGGVVEFGAKTYACGQQVYLASNVELCGVEDSSVLLVKAETPGFILLWGYNKDCVIVRDMKFDGNFANRLPQPPPDPEPVPEIVHQAIQLYGCRSCLVENCTFVNFGKQYGDLNTVRPSGAILLIGIRETDEGDSFGNRIIGNRILDPDGFASFAVRVLSRWDEDKPDNEFVRLNRGNTISGNYIEGTRWNGIEIAGPASRYNTIADNYLRNVCGVRGVESDKGAIGNTFSHNIVDGFLPNCVGGGVMYIAFCDQGDPGDGYPERFSQDNTWIGNVAKGGVQKYVRDDQGELVLIGLFGFLFSRSKRAIVKGFQVFGYTAIVNNYLVGGMYADCTLEDARIDGCIVKNVPVGINFEGGPEGPGELPDSRMDNILVTGSVFDCTYRAIWSMTGQNITKGRLTVVDNSIKCSGESAEFSVLIYSFDKVIISGNLISGKKVYFPPEYTGDVLFVGNQVFDISGVAVDVDDAKAKVLGNAGANYFRSKQESLLAAGSLSLDPSTDTVIVTTNGTIDRMATCFPGRRILLVSGSGSVVLRHLASGQAADDEFYLQGGVNITLGLRESLRFEGFDAGGGIVMWVMA